MDPEALLFRPDLTNTRLALAYVLEQLGNARDGLELARTRIPLPSEALLDRLLASEGGVDDMPGVSLLMSVECWQHNLEASYHEIRLFLAEPTNPEPGVTP